MRMIYWLLAFSILTHSSAWATCSANVQATAPDQRFIIDAANGLVTDKVTGLIWQRCSLGQSGSDCSGGSASTHNWQAALQAAEDNSFAGYNDWRLPNIKELRSILEDRCYNPATNSAVFPNTIEEAYWSASPSAASSAGAWGVYFSSGNDYYDYKYSDYYVRLVRGGS